MQTPSDAINCHHQIIRSWENLLLELVLGKNKFLTLALYKPSSLSEKDFSSHLEYAISFYNKSGNNITRIGDSSFATENKNLNHFTEKLLLRIYVF